MSNLDDASDALDGAIEKARGLMPGGSGRMFRAAYGARERAFSAGIRNPNGLSRFKRLRTLTRYLANRHGGGKGPGGPRAGTYR